MKLWNIFTSFERGDNYLSIDVYNIDILIHLDGFALTPWGILEYFVGFKSDGVKWVTPT